MLNSATLIVIFLFILSAVLFASISVSIALYYAKRKADTEEKALIEENDYIKIILIFSLINFITSFAAVALSPNFIAAHISAYFLLIFAAGLIEFFISKFAIFKRFSCSKTEKTKRAAIFAAICAPYYIFLVTSPLLLYMIAYAMDPC